MSDLPRASREQILAKSSYLRVLCETKDLLVVAHAFDGAVHHWRRVKGGNQWEHFRTEYE